MVNRPALNYFLNLGVEEIESVKKLFWLISTVLLLSLSLGKVVIADDGNYDFATDLSSYEEGDIPKAYLGEAIVVKSYTNDSGELVKYITSQKGEDAAALSIEPIKAAREFEVILEVNNSSIFLLSISNNETKIDLSFYSNCWATLGNNNEARCTKTSTEVHTIKLKVKDGVVKSYINSDFFQTHALEQPDAIFTKIQISEIGNDDAIYFIKGSNLNGSPNTAPDIEGSYGDGFNAGKQTCISNPASCGITVSNGGASCPTTNSGDGIQLPTIAPNLNLHIPTIEYQSLGGKMNLWVDLQFTTTDDGKMWWILDDYGVNP